MHRIIVYLLIVFFNSISFASTDNVKKIYITQIIEHQSLDKVRYAFIKTLAEHGFIDGKNIKITFRSAQGNIPTAVQIAKKFVSESPDLIVAISTPSAQTIVNANKNADYPVIFAAVSNPVYADLVKDINHVKRNITGVTDEQPIVDQLQLIKDLMPNIKKLGVIYNSGEINSVRIVSEIKKNVKDFEIVDAVVLRPSESAVILQNVINKIDALYIPLDNMVVSSIQSVLKVARENNIPVFTADPDLVKSRAIVASIGIGYKEIGKITGEKAVKILNGEKANSLKIGPPTEIKLYIDNKTMEKFGFTLPEKYKNNIIVYY